MTVKTKTKIGTIDLTPTWEGLLPMLLLAYSEGTTANARNTAFAELQCMARIADQYVAAQKESK